VAAYEVFDGCAAGEGGGVKPYYEDGSVTIYHGDCREILSDLWTAGAIVSDPPYGMAYEHGARKGGVQLGHDGHSIVGDDEPFDPGHLLALKAPTILWGANHFADRLPASRGWLIWDKRDGRPSNDQSDCELAWTNILTTARQFSRYWSGGVRTGREQTEGRLHVNQKPIELMHWCLGFTEGVVLDPYCGSGSTLVAAKELGRKAIGIEIEERNCEIAAKRCAQECLDLEAA
jgi:site-specific DNA-methyltransferase (adenine-specific)